MGLSRFWDFINFTVYCQVVDIMEVSEKHMCFTYGILQHSPESCSTVCSTVDRLYGSQKKGAGNGESQPLISKGL